MRRALRKIVWLAALATSGAAAEDIDLFVGAPPTSANLPNVLFVIDNTANWNQAFENERSAIANTLRALPADAFNVGIMLATESGSPNNNIKGGYVRAAIRPMNAANKQLYADLIASFDKLADKGDGGYSALTMAEAYYYLTSGTPYAGNLKVKTDYRTNASGTAASRAVYALPGNALESLGGTRYAGPDASSCTKTYVIYVSNGPNQQNSSADSLANTMLQRAGGSTSVIPLSPSGSQSNPSDEWAGFMLERGIVTYTIDVDPGRNGQGPGWTALLKSMAKEESRYTAVHSGNGGADIATAITRALSEIQAVNSVFASVSLPLSVNTQETFSNQVYVGLFRPDADGLPRWAGNLKQYKMGRRNGQLELQDADGNHAINGLTGFITECARSHWTPSSPDAYWAFNPSGACIAPGSDADAYKRSNFPDGNVVEKGGQAHVTRSAPTRTLKTCSPVFGNCGGTTSFDTGNSAITAALLGAASSTERNQLIAWARGLDVLDENRNGNTTEIRPSVHGDVLHSRPAAINLGTESSPKVIVMYSGNDGVLRAVNGNRTESIGGVPAGGELWAFMPPEFYGHIKRLHDNDVQINFPNVSPATNPRPKPYGIDGPIEAYKNGSTSTWLFASMRRGGRALYAFDIHANDPTDIRVKWKQGCPVNLAKDSTANDAGCTPNLSGIGQTWSSPKVFKSSALGGAPLLIFGGGYDPCEDNDPHTCTSATKGNKIYVLDADSGDVVRTLNTDRGVIADIIIVPNSTTGRAQFGYTADLGGNVYRIDLRATNAADWSITKVASLGCDTGTGNCARNRKFMFTPDVVVEDDTIVLLLGSGDREKPRNYANPVENYFFVLKDQPNNPNWLSSEVANCGVAALCLNSLTPILSAANPTQEALAARKGWYLGMRATEQVVTSALTIYGTITFSTHQPRQAQANVCSSDLGAARVYNISYVDASSRNGTADRSEEQPATIGLSPNPVGGVVTLDDGQRTTFIIGAEPCGPLCPSDPPGPATSVPTPPKSRVYWYIER